MHRCVSTRSYQQTPVTRSRSQPRPVWEHQPASPVEGANLSYPYRTTNSDSCSRQGRTASPSGSPHPGNHWPPGDRSNEEEVDAIVEEHEEHSTKLLPCKPRGQAKGSNCRNPALPQVTATRRATTFTGRAKRRGQETDGAKPVSTCLRHESSGSDPPRHRHSRTHQHTHRHSTHHTPRDCWNRAGVHVLRTSPPAKSQACCGSKQGRTSPTPALRLRSPARLLGRRFGPQQRAHRFGSRFPPRKAGAPIAASCLAPYPRAGASMRTCAALRWATRYV